MKEALLLLGHLLQDFHGAICIEAAAEEQKPTVFIVPGQFRNQRAAVFVFLFVLLSRKYKVVDCRRIASDIPVELKQT